MEKDIEMFYCQKCSAWLGTNYLDENKEIIMHSYSSDYIEGKNICRVCLEEINGERK